jgi:hypothetical protein
MLLIIISLWDKYFQLKFYPKKSFTTLNKKNHNKKLLQQKNRKPNKKVAMTVNSYPNKLTYNIFQKVMMNVYRFAKSIYAARTLISELPLICFSGHIQSHRPKKAANFLPED